MVSARHLHPVLRFSIVEPVGDIMMEYSRNRPSSRDRLSAPSTLNRGGGRILWVRRSPVEFRGEQMNFGPEKCAKGSRMICGSVLIQYERHTRERTDMDGSLGSELAAVGVGRRTMVSDRKRP